MNPEDQVSQVIPATHPPHLHPSEAIPIVKNPESVMFTANQLSTLSRNVRNLTRHANPRTTPTLGLRLHPRKNIDLNTQVLDKKSLRDLSLVDRRGIVIVVRILLICDVNRVKNRVSRPTVRKIGRLRVRSRRSIIARMMGVIRALCMRSLGLVGIRNLGFL
jgi:hypothetical protein